MEIISKIPRFVELLTVLGVDKVHGLILLVSYDLIDDVSQIYGILFCFHYELPIKVIISQLIFFATAFYKLYILPEMLIFPQCANFIVLPSNLFLRLSSLLLLLLLTLNFTLNHEIFWIVNFSYFILISDNTTDTI